MVHQLIYASAATGDWQPAVLLELLHGARHRNTRAGVTGMLAFSSGTFLQFLEGPEQAVNATLVRIRKDSRHADLTVLVRREASARWFPDWSMGFEELDQIIPGPGINAHVPRPGPVSMWVADPDAALDFFDRCRSTQAPS